MARYWLFSLLLVGICSVWCDAGTSVAVKLLVHAPMDDTLLSEFTDEVAVLNALRHPNIVRLTPSLLTFDSPGRQVLFMGACSKGPDYCIVTELVARGSLWAYLHSSTDK